MIDESNDKVSTLHSEVCDVCNEALNLASEFEKIAKPLLSRPIQRVVTDHLIQIERIAEAAGPLEPDDLLQLADLLDKQLTYYRRMTVGQSIVNFGRCAYVEPEHAALLGDLTRQAEAISDKLGDARSQVDDMRRLLEP
jgi:hypothetical protein